MEFHSQRNIPTLAVTAAGIMMSKQLAFFVIVQSAFAQSLVKAIVLKGETLTVAAYPVRKSKLRRAQQRTYFSGEQYFLPPPEEIVRLY
jgi:hypothetical protein